MIIDGHAHACGNYLRNDTMTQSMHAHNVEYIVLSAGELNSTKIYHMVDRTEQQPDKDVVNSLKYLIKMIITVTGATRQIPAGNAYVHTLKQENSRIKQFYWITHESMADIRQHYQAMRYDGVKIHQCWVKRDISSPWFAELAAFLIEHDLPLFIHLGSYHQVGQIIDFQKRYHELKLIIGHCYGLELFVKRAREISSNVYFDSSNNYFVSKKRLLTAVNTFGAQRVLLGSDTPYGQDSLRLTIARINSLEIPQDAKENILGKNLAKLLNIHGVLSTGDLKNTCHAPPHLM